VNGLAREITALCDLSEGILADSKDSKSHAVKSKKRATRDSDEDCSSDSDYIPE
jgi:hypothetical protein